MKLPHLLLRLSIAATLFGSLAACTIVPAHPHAYGGPAVYVETYPAYRYGQPQRHYHYDRHDHRHYDDHDDRRRYERRRYESPLESAARSHREIRRSLGLPRLPGMP